MSERYIKVFSGNENLYADNAPIVIRASALLKDTETGRIIAQIKLQNVSGKTISYVKTRITQLDALKNPIDKVVAFEYLDLAVADKEEFGSKKPLPLPNSSTRSFCVEICNVGFADGSTWTSDHADWKPMTEESAAVNAVAIADTYNKARALSKSGKAEVLQQAIEIFESISDKKDVSAEIHACEKKIEKIRKRKTKKKALKISALLAGVCVVLGLAGYFIGYPLVSVLNGDYSVYVTMYNVKEYKIPDGATTIGAEEFKDCTSLTSIAIPDSVTSIEDGAFMNCTNLTSVTFGENSQLESIGIGAFESCIGLTSIEIPDSVTYIGEFAFYGCDNLQSVYITNLAKWCTIYFSPPTSSPLCYGADLYINGKKATKLVIPEGVTTISFDAFENCESLTSVEIPEGVVSVGSFDGCTNLKRIDIAHSVTEIAYSAFSECPNLKSIYYDGTKAEWNKLYYESSWSSSPPKYTVYCSDGKITP